MSFPRHREIYPSDGDAVVSGRAPAHRLDEFPAGYSSAVCSPAGTASASPAGFQYAVQLSCRSRIFHRTVNSVLTGCLTPGDKRIFIGLSSVSVDEMTDEIKASGCQDWEGCRAVVVLCHYGPGPSEDAKFAAAVREMLGCNFVLFLHGHEHPRDFTGTEWRTVVTDSSTVFRSKVCSSVSRRRGLGHRIEWDGQLFRYTVVQG